MKKIMVAVLLAQFLFAAAYSADFLTGARGGGIGFSYFVLGDDPSGALYNPAALGFTEGWQSQFMYNKRNNYGYLSFRV
jgi:opacity protein-like surface antigen